MLAADFVSPLNTSKLKQSKVEFQLTYHKGGKSTFRIDKLKLHIPVSQEIPEVHPRRNRTSFQAASHHFVVGKLAKFQLDLLGLSTRKQKGSAVPVMIALAGVTK